MALGTALSNYQANKRLTELVREDFRNAIPGDDTDAALYRHWLNRRRRGHGRYPGPGNSTTIMRNRVLRAQSFGLYHDGMYER